MIFWSTIKATVYLVAVRKHISMSALKDEITLTLKAVDPNYIV